MWGEAWAQIPALLLQSTFRYSLRARESGSLALRTGREDPRSLFPKATASKCWASVSAVLCTGTVAGFQMSVMLSEHTSASSFWSEMTQIDKNIPQSFSTIGKKVPIFRRVALCKHM